jgi:RNA polymerase sigma factor (sigma-70 family)
MCQSDATPPAIVAPEPAVRSIEDRNRLVEQWSGLVPFVMRRMWHWPLVRRHEHECTSAAYLGLLKAAEIWRPGPAAFANFAIVVIRRRIMNELDTIKAKSRAITFSDIDLGPELEFDPPAAPEADEAEQRDDAANVRAALKSLSPRDRAVISARYGLDDGEGKTLEEIGEAMGVTRERVRQREARGLRRLRRALG